MESLWKQFLKTGSIKDYLQYSYDESQKSEEIKARAARQDEWVKNNAGFTIGDRHGDQDRTNWRI